MKDLPQSTSKQQQGQVKKKNQTNTPSRTEIPAEVNLEPLAALSLASQAVAASLDLKQVLKEVMDLAGGVAGSDYISIVMLDEAGQISGGMENLPEMLSIDRRARKNGFTSWIARHCRAVAVDNIDPAGRVMNPIGDGAPRRVNPHLVAQKIRSFAGLPLMVDQHIAGVLYLHSLREGTFHGQLPLLTTFANQAAIAIEKARLYNEVRKELTERKLADEALERSHSLLQAALDSTADGLLVAEGNGRITQFNRKFTELWHIPPEILGDNDDEKAIAFVLDQLKAPQAFLDKIRELYSRPEAESFDVLEFKDGRTFERFSQPHRLAGKTVGRVWSFRDITARRQAEAALSKSEAQLRALVEEIPATIYTESADEPGKILYISPQIETITGYKPSKWLSSPNFWREISHPDDRENLRAKNERSLQTGEPFRAEYRIYKRDGEVLWISGEAVLVRDEAGKPLFWQGIMHDISDKKKAEKAQRESEARFSTIFKTSPIGISITRLSDGRLIEANQALLDMLGHRREEVIGKDISREKTGVVAEDRERILQKLQNGEQVRGLEAKFRRKSGGLGDLLISVEKIELDGESHSLSVMQDISERKQTEEALARQAEELLRRNEELARLYRATGSLIAEASPNIEEQAEKIVRVVHQEFGQDNCSLYIAKVSSNELVRLAEAGTFVNQLTETKLSLDGDSLIAEVLRTGKSMNVPDVNASSHYIPNWEAAQSELIIPLKAGGSSIGVIDVQSPEPYAFSADDERIMSIFAERAGLELEHSRLNTQMEARIQQLVALRTVDMAISGSFDINLTLGILLEQVTGQLGIHAADILIFSLSTQTFRFSCERGFRLQTLRHVQLNYGMGYVWDAVRQRQAVRVADITSGPDGLQRTPDLSAEHFVAYIGLPLIAKGQVKGILEVYQREPLNLEPESYSFLEMLAGQAAIAIDNAELFDNLQSSHSELSQAYEKTLEGWASALELRDRNTEGHTRRTTDLTIRLARAMGLNDNEITHLYRGALLHDIGKMGVPDSIMSKPGPLTEEEWVSMRKHPLYAYEMLSPISYLRLAVDIPYCHHERWDGTGYPRGLKGEQIPLAARIFAVVDVWDALTSDRPYRKEWTKEQARAYIEEHAGTQFDPEVVKTFLREIE